MATPSREIEFKFAVTGRQAFEYLLKQLNLPVTLLDTGVTQTNHFFDSPVHCLQKNHLAIRLREENGSYILTIKSGQLTNQQVNNLLTDRIEEEVLLPQVTADGLLQGNISPRQAIIDNFKSRSEHLLHMIGTACNSQDLVHIGKFSNIRVHLPPVTVHAGNSSEQLEFELDTSTFPDGSTEYECEVEISGHSDAAAIEAALIRLFQQAGIEWHTAPSKAKRFYTAITS